MPLRLAGWPTRSPLRTAGTGGKPELGEEAAQESHQEIAGAVSGADMVRRAALSRATA
jgi:cell division GTPase FtsZ